MNKEIKAEWVAALRSGQYTQGVGYLARQYHGIVRHCVMGVLCEIAATKGVVSRTVWAHTISFDGRTQILPERVVLWAGLSDADLSINGRTLEALNDYDNLDFEQIAAIIEAHM